MTDLSGDERLKMQRKVAREYRKLGYKVTETLTGEDLPAFLSGFSSDLIAVNDDRCVVVEIKRADTLKGSNDLVELAARVAEHPNWRFELVTLAAPEAPEGPVPSEAALRELFDATLRAFEAGDAAQRRVALTALVLTLERLLDLIAVEHGIQASDRSMKALIGELSFQGVIDEPTATMLDRASDWRNVLWNGGTRELELGRADVAQVVDAGRVLQSALIEFWDGGAVARREVEYTAAAVAQLPEAKPVVYAVQAASGRVNYIGSAAAGHVRERIRQHVSGRSRRAIGEKIVIRQYETVEAARRAEETAIQEFWPKYKAAPPGSEPSSLRA